MLAHERLLGTIRFISELFELKMVSEAIIHTCAVELLKDDREQTLEYLCLLLSMVGKDLDNDVERVRNTHMHARTHAHVPMHKPNE